MKFGIFGGTLNPIHFGHLRSAEEAREAFSLDKVLFVPAAIPPFGKEDVESPHHRMEMAKIAIEGNPCFGLSDIEVRRGGISYSIDTVEALRKEIPDIEAYFIVGLDAFSEIGSWKEYRRFFSLSNFIIVTRPGYQKGAFGDFLPLEVRNDFCYDSAKGCYTHTSGNCFGFLEVTLLDISSTEIRSRLKVGKSVKYLIPEKVEEYILKNKLYTTKTLRHQENR